MCVLRNLTWLAVSPSGTSRHVSGSSHGTRERATTTVLKDLGSGRNMNSAALCSACVRKLSLCKSACCMAHRPSQVAHMAARSRAASTRNHNPYAIDNSRRAFLYRWKGTPYASLIAFGTCTCPEKQATRCLPALTCI